MTWFWRKKNSKEMLSWWKWLHISISKRSKFKSFRRNLSSRPRRSKPPLFMPNSTRTVSSEPHHLSAFPEANPSLCQITLDKLSWMVQPSCRETILLTSSMPIAVPLTRRFLQRKWVILRELKTNLNNTVEAEPEMLLFKKYLLKRTPTLCQGLLLEPQELLTI